MPTISRWAATAARWGALGLPLLLLACAQKPPAQQAAAAHVFYADTIGGAHQCSASKPELKPAQQSTATMQVGNDGGWCAIRVALDGKPYASALLTEQARHGRVFIHPVGDDTRIDYTPETGYAGADAFTVQLIPGNPVLHVTVTVTR